MRLKNAQLDILLLGIKNLNKHTGLSAMSALTIARLQKKLSDASQPYNETKTKIINKYLNDLYDKENKKIDPTKNPEKYNEMVQELNPLLEEDAWIEIEDTLNIKLIKDDWSINSDILKWFIDVYGDNFSIEN